MQRNDPTRFEPAFTLVELILVMALLATILALSAPSLSRSMRQRHLQDEAARFLALTEYARNEAVSQGVPMVVWIEPETHRFGLSAKTGYVGDSMRARSYLLDPEMRIEVANGALRRGLIEDIEFTPDGTLTPTSTESVRLIDRFDSTMTIARTDDGWGYEILEETR
jgi:general secretion pathway protein H